jgi:hypothetical protein
MASEETTITEEVAETWFDRGYQPYPGIYGNLASTVKRQFSRSFQDYATRCFKAYEEEYGDISGVDMTSVLWADCC